MSKASELLESRKKRKLIENAMRGADPHIVLNAMTARSDLLRKMFDPRRDLNKECGYPETITVDEYRRMYDRGIGKRVVNVYPEESWKLLPTITEDDNPESETAFETALQTLDDQFSVYHYMQRIDELSGIGSFGLLLIGVSDGEDLEKPIQGVEEAVVSQIMEPEKPINTASEHKVIYIRALDERLVDISTYETDKRHPRYGKPVFYSITLNDPRSQAENTQTTPPDNTRQKVHWTRVVHLADNRTTSEVVGTPRQKPVWDYLLNLRKILGGNGEMFYRGGFPGVSLETQSGAEDAILDEEKTRQAMESYMNGLQRYIALEGLSAKSLAPQIAEPSESFQVQIKAICATIGVPYRVFLGTEEAQLAGEQDAKAWNGRLKNRQNRYLTPMLVRPIIDRFIALGALPSPSKRYEVVWPDSHEPTDIEIAKELDLITSALGKYVDKGVDLIIPPKKFLTMFLRMEPKDVEEILADAISHIKDVDTEGKDTVGHLTPPMPEPVVGAGGPPNGAPKPAGSNGTPKQKAGA